jgi:cytochrome c oxidase assembly protein subunit 15
VAGAFSAPPPHALDPGAGGIWLHRYAVAVAVCTALLVFAGGLVTSTGSGLAVPDWPLSYGMLMPPMVGNVRFEHGHRMVATFVGLLTIGLAVWLWRREPRRWLRRLGWAALGAVVLQGTLGGITVLLFLPAPVSVAHASIGQTFFCIVVSIALFTSPGWRRSRPYLAEAETGVSLRTLSILTVAALYVQLLLGATMRHIEAGLAIPDFPLAFGRLVPPLGSAPVAVHFAHRVWAGVVAAAIVVTALRVLRRHGAEPALARPAALLLGLASVQILMGAVTVWTRKSPVPTTLHVLGGALLLATAVVLVLRSHRLTLPRARRAAVFEPATPARAAT